MRKTLAALTLALPAVGLLGVMPASSAVAYRIWTEPAEPIVGEQAAIYVATFWPESTSPSGGLVPMSLPDFLWDFVADSPAGSRFAVPLQPMGNTSNQWVGRFTFDEIGQWEVGLDPRHLGRPADPALGARTTVVVRGTNGAPDLWPVLVAVVGVGTVVLVASLVVSPRRSRKAG